MLIFTLPFRWFVLMFVLVVAAMVFVVRVSDPAARIVVSKETTYITEPLAEDGLPDFEKYLLETGFEGVTPENNAAVLLWRAFWPAGLSEEYRELMREVLGLDASIDDEPGLVKLSHDETVDRVAAWLREQYPSKFPDDKIETDSPPYGLGQNERRYKLKALAKDAIELSQKRPWSGSELPPLAEWLAENQQPLDWIREASHRPRYYSPPPNFLDVKRSEGLLMALLPLTQNLRDGCQGLLAEAMWLVTEGRADEAIANCMACLRLANMVSHEFSLIHKLVAGALNQRACEQMVVVLHHGDLTAEELRQLHQQLAMLPSRDPITNALHIGERMMAIDMVIALATARVDFGDFDQAATAVASLSIDWNLVLKDTNVFFDRIAEAISVTDRTERNVQLAELESELASRAGRELSLQHGLSMLFSTQSRSRAVGGMFLDPLAPVLSMAAVAEDRALTLRELTKVAAALAVYRAEHGEYPESLEQLVPDILPEMPIDLYSGEPFIYRPRDDGGYLLYSVYENGTDNGGTDLGGEIVAGEWGKEKVDVGRDESDLVFRVPVPEFELPGLE